MKSRFNFCAESALRHRSEVEPWDEAIYESPSFIALPTRGALVEGWLLIVPRTHHFCIGGFTPELLTELALFRREVQAAVRAVYGDTVVFEHGPANSHRPAGCGVDHAHLHIVPWRGVFAAAIQKHGSPQFRWRSVAGCEVLRARHQRGEDYLYFEEADGDAFVTSGLIPSQYFRRIVAAELGTPELFDWKQHSGIVNVQATLSALRAAVKGAIAA